MYGWVNGHICPYLQIFVVDQPSAYSSMGGLTGVGPGDPEQAGAEWGSDWKTKNDYGVVSLIFGHTLKWNIDLGSIRSTG